MFLLWLLLAIVGGFWISGLQSRVTRLERILDEEYEYEEPKTPESGFVANLIDEPAEPEEEVFEATPAAPLVAGVQTTKKKAKPSMSFEDLLTKRLFPILGSLSLTLAIGYFVVMAITNDWIGPVGQIAFAAAASLTLLGLGEFARPKYSQYFSYLSATGIAGLIMTTFAARSFYDLISAPESMIAYILIVALGVWLAIRYDRRELANLSILGGLLAPTMAQSPEPSATGLMLFLLILAVAGFLVSVYKKWPELLVMLLIGVSFYEFSLAGHNAFGNQPLLYLGLIYGIHLLLGSGGFVRSVLAPKDKQSEAEEAMDVVVFVGSVILANFLGYHIFAGQGWDHFGFFVLLQGFGFLGLAQWSRQRGLDVYHRLCTLGALSSVLFATLWELRAAEELILTMVLAVESLFLSWSARVYRDDLFKIFNTIAAVFALMFMLQIDGIWWSLIGLIGAGSALMASAHVYENPDFSDMIKALAAISVSGAVLWWNYEYFVDWSADWSLPSVVPFVFLMLWAAGLSVLSLMKGNQVYAWVAGGFFALCNAWAWSEYGGDLLNAVFVLGLFIVMSIYFMLNVSENENISLPEKPLYYGSILILAATQVLFFGLEALDDLERIIFWLITGGGLAALGLHKTWVMCWYAGLGFFALASLLGLGEYNDDLVASGGLLILFLLVGGGLSFLASSSAKLNEGRLMLLNGSLLLLSVAQLIVFGHQALDEPVRTVFWIVSGLVFLFVGLQKNWDLWRYAGLGLILLVIAKLYLFDVWQWELWVRFVAFFALGAALLGITFYYQYLNKKK